MDELSSENASLEDRMRKVLEEKKAVTEKLNLITTQADEQKIKYEDALKESQSKNVELENEIYLIKDTHKKVC